MAQDLIFNDLLVSGTVSAKALTLTSASITDAMVVAATGVQASKLQHQYEPNYSQPFAQSATVERKVLHVVRGATATLIDFKVGASTAAIGGATAVIDLLINGVTTLTAQITLDNGTAAFALKAGALSGTALTVGQVVEVNVVSATVGGGTLAKGLFCVLGLREDAQ